MSEIDTNELAKLRDHIEDLEAERDKLTDLLSDAEDYLEHRPGCARLVTKKECDCGLVELQTRVHKEIEGEENEVDEDEDDDEETPK